MAGEWMRAEDEAEFAATRELLVDRRLALGLTQLMLAERLGTTQSAVSDLERGKTTPTTVTVRRWAAVLGMRARISWELTERGVR